MIEDSVLREVWEARESYAKSFGFNVRAMVAELREQDDRGDWQVVRLEPRRPASLVPSNSRHRNYEGERPL